MDTFVASSSFISLLLLVGFVEVGASWNGCAEAETRCGDLVIRFPFSIKGHQPQHCGYPGLDLECFPSNNLTVLHLPRTVKLNVKTIDYKSQRIALYDPSGCLYRQLRNLTLSVSPFQFRAHSLDNYTFFNCPPKHTKSLDSVPTCLSSSNQVYAISSGAGIRQFPLLFCTKVFDISSIPFEFLSDRNVLHLMWSYPMCKHCESQRNRCGFKNHNGSLETTCFEGRHKGSSTKSIITGSILGSLILLLAMAVAIYRIYNFLISRKENRLIIKKFLKDYEALKPTRYSYSEIKRITNGFEDKLGEGAYGVVYKGKISGQYTVAVKLLTNSQGNGEDFINEVGIISRIHHVNIVRLIGFCADGFRRALVYEFLPNGSLQNFINSFDNRKNFLDWEKLQEIALGIAKGIEYLHQGCDECILHFDIKPQNVLLDHRFTPKICDFGLAKLCSKDQSVVSMTNARGTLGYIAPEVFSRNFGNVSCKSDVYSFGMLLLEIIGGRKITEENTSHIHYPEWIYSLLEEREDGRIHIEDGRDAKIERKLAIVGLWSIQWHAVDRPSMQVVVQMLEGDGEELEVPPNPFVSEGPTGKRKSVPARRPIKGLEIIHEVEGDYIVQ